MRKLSRVLGGLLLVLMLSSCGGDDESCTASEWVGTWSGTINCSDGTSQAISIDITSIDETTISINDGSDITELEVNGCKESYDVSLDFFGVQVEITTSIELDGEAILIDIETSADGENNNCSGSLTR